MDAENSRTKTRKRGAGGITRRDFARQVALVTATAAAGLSASASLLEAAHPTPESPQQAPKTPSLAPQGQAEVEGRIHAILGRYGDRLSEAQKADVQRLATEMQRTLEELRAYSLSNSDMPGTILKVIVEREKPRPNAPAARPAKPKG